MEIMCTGQVKCQWVVKSMQLLNQLMRVEIENAIFEASASGALLIPYVPQNG